jgi:hypothetical protein
LPCTRHAAKKVKERLKNQGLPVDAICEVGGGPPRDSSEGPLLHQGAVATCISAWLCPS